MGRTIEINCDMGEGFGRWKMGPDEELMKYVDVANVACGFHAGDPSIMRNTVRLAKKYNIKVGAHPGLQDLFGFGRRRMSVAPDDMYAMVLYQVGALKAMLDAEGVALHHVKPHGELFFYMHRDSGIMDAVLRAVRAFGVPVYGIPNDAQAQACRRLGIPFTYEFYPDVDYNDAGTLVPVAESVATTPELIGERIRRFVAEDAVLSNSGSTVPLGFSSGPFSICIHSDLPHALENAQTARQVVSELSEK
ncbi:hypothetical protein F4775DRAFT_578514 [Biscogniauxia sp. FL1348]|nr:hypothetical protein F4775DRAFT_578514 [Biscogniauxia sp. FL1348]